MAFNSDCLIESDARPRHSNGMQLPSTPPHPEKQRLRAQMLRQRLQLQPPVIAQATTSLARHFADHPILAFAASFAGYIPMRGEADVLGVFDAMQRFHKRMALPCVTDEKGLLFREWSPGAPLHRHALGMQEPLADAPEILPEIVLVPLLAFDAFGGRLGYGGGYYDRAMARLRATDTPPLFVGVAYSMQEVEQVPLEAQDALLDGVLTELGVSMFRP